MIRLIFFLVLTGFSVSSFSQSEYPCAAIEMQRRREADQPDLFERRKALDDSIQARALRAEKIGSLAVTLPVVIHIIHQNGVENLSDNKITAAIQHLNEAFSHTGAYATAGNGVNTDIQFCLAMRTPANQPTTGINRVVSPLTNMTMENQDDDLKNLSRWNPLHYINIWVVNSISSISSGPGVAGYAYLASAHGTAYDGIVIEAGFLGDANTDVVLIHEMGHYLNLYHTFEGGCNNNLCDQDGDKVCDTPPDMALHSACVFNSCPTDAIDIRLINPFTTDVNDMTENFMDYSPFTCQYAFTQGQSNRMQLAITGARSTLLESPGCMMPCNSALTATFSEVSGALTGVPVQLMHTGVGANYWEWSDNGVLFSADKNPVHIFTEPGLHVLKLYVSNNFPNCIAVSYDTVLVNCNVEADFWPKDTVVTPGATVTFTSVNNAATDLIWKINDTPTGSGDIFNHTFATPGSYLIQLTAANAYCSVEVFGRVRVPSACGDTAIHYRYTGVNALGLVWKQAPDGAWLGVGQGNFSNYLYAAKLDKNGEVMWSNRRLIGGAGFGSVGHLPDGSHLLAYRLGADLMSFVIEKITPDGQTIWAKSYEGADFPVKIIVNNDYTFVALLPNAIIKFDSAGNVIWANIINDPYGFYQMIQKPGGGYWVSGTTTGTFNSRFFMHISESGSIVKHTSMYNNTVGGGGEQICLLPDGGFTAIIGMDGFSARIFARFKPDLSVAWAKKCPTPDYSSIYMLNADSGEILVGKKRTTSADDFACLNLDGTVKWAVKIESGLSSYFMANQSDPADNWILFKQINNGFLKLQINPGNRPEGCLFSETTFPLKDTTWAPLSINYTLTPVSVASSIYTPIIQPFSLVQTEFCQSYSVCPEICDNNLDDDLDGQIDCADPDCDCNPCLEADLSVSVDSVWCAQGTVFSRVKVCNAGQQPAPAGTPLAIYNADPFVSAASPVAEVYALPLAVQPGQCRAFDVPMNAFTSGAVYAVINDNYQSPTPLTQPAGSLAECRLDNNMGNRLFVPPVLPLPDLGPDQSICPGSITVLTAPAGYARYRWQNGADGQSFTAFSPGKYWVEVEDACGGVFSDTIELMLQTQNIPELGADRTICSGDTLEWTIQGVGQLTWWPQAVTGCVSCEHILIYPTVSTTIYVTAATGNCFASDSVRITVRERPTISLENQSLSCLHSEVTLTAQVTPANAIVQWQNAQQQPLNGQSPTVDQPGVYFVTATSADGLCTASATLTVQDSALIPPIDLGADRTICRGDSISWALEGFDQVNWTSDTWLSCTNCSSVVVYAETDFRLQVIVNWNGCTATDTVDIKVADVPVITVENQVLTCLQDAVLLAASITPVDAAFQWFDALMQPLSGTIPIVTAPGLYSIIATDATGQCSATTAVQVESVLTPPAVDLGNDFVHCDANPVQIGVAPENGAVYSWNNGATTSTITVAAPGVYILNAVLGHCTATDTIAIQFSDAPEVDLGDNRNLCFGDTLLIGIPAEPGVSYQWNNGVLTSLQQVTQSGFYILTAGKGQCKTSDTIQVQFFNFPLVDLGPDQLICQDSQITIGAPQQLYVTYQWNTGQQTNEITVSKSGRYVLTISLTDCSVSDTIEVRIQPCIDDINFYLPNVFSSSGQSQNQVYLPGMTPGIDLISYRLTIFDRWGDMIFRSTDPQTGWDGTWGGKKAISSVYVGLLEINYRQGSTVRTFRKYQTITLIH